MIALDAARSRLLPCWIGNSVAGCLAASMQIRSYNQDRNGFLPDTFAQLCLQDMSCRTVIGFCVTAAVCFTVDRAPADVIRLAVQKTGTVAWVLDVIRAHQLDKGAGITIKI